jgi:predicted glycoside hydrolase/deacetylase ChbG (UPF0249 family)
LAVISYFEKGVEKLLKRGEIAYTDYFKGFLDSGNLTEETLLRLIGSLNEGVTELVCHPGFIGPEVVDQYRFHVNSEAELFALTSPRVKKLIRASGVELTTFRGVGVRV